MPYFAFARCSKVADLKGRFAKKQKHVKKRPGYGRIKRFKIKQVRPERLPIPPGLWPRFHNAVAKNIKKHAFYTMCIDNLGNP